MEKLDTQQVILGTLIALLRRQIPPLGIVNQIAEGIKIAKKLTVDADIQHDAGELLILAEMITQMDFKSQDVGVYLQPEWEAKEGNDKNFHATASAPTHGNYALETYTVPVGKTLYLTQLGCFALAVNAADQDLEQMVRAEIYDNTDSEYLFSMGGNGGVAISFSKPIVIEAEHEVYIWAINCGNHAMSLGVSAGGYEI